MLVPVGCRRAVSWRAGGPAPRRPCAGVSSRSASTRSAPNAPAIFSCSHRGSTPVALVMPSTQRGTHSSGAPVRIAWAMTSATSSAVTDLTPFAAGTPADSSVFTIVGSTTETSMPCGLELGPGGLAEADGGELRRGVGGSVGHRDPAHGRGDVDDVAAAALDHAGRDGLGAVDQAVHVDVDDRAGDGVGLLEHRAERHDAGVVDEYVDRPDLAHLGEEALPRLGAGDVQVGADRSRDRRAPRPAGPGRCRGRPAPRWRPARRAAGPSPPRSLGPHR